MKCKLKKGIINIKFAYPIKKQQQGCYLPGQLQCNTGHVHVCERAHALIQTRFQKALDSHIKNVWTLKSVRPTPSKHSVAMQAHQPHYLDSVNTPQSPFQCWSTALQKRTLMHLNGVCMCVDNVFKTLSE